MAATHSGGEREHAHMSQRVVIKVGGSLLDSLQTPPRLRDYLIDHWNDCQVNLLVGGGPMVDAMRFLDAIHQFDPIATHWRCIELMQVTSEILGDWLPHATTIDQPLSLQAHIEDDRRGVFVIKPSAFYTRSDHACLPQSWSTTSDSIGALLAKKLNIPKLVLLKACDVPSGTTIDDAVNRGIVDDAFREASKGLEVVMHSLASPALRR
jgi:5-(aminomethyl)-3-furanmethanol phosphate kinase